MLKFKRILKKLIKRLLFYQLNRWLKDIFYSTVGAVFAVIIAVTGASSFFELFSSSSLFFVNWFLGFVGEVFSFVYLASTARLDVEELDDVGDSNLPNPVEDFPSEEENPPTSDEAFPMEAELLPPGPTGVEPAPPREEAASLKEEPAPPREESAPPKEEAAPPNPKPGQKPSTGMETDRGKESLFKERRSSRPFYPYNQGGWGKNTLPTIPETETPSQIDKAKWIFNPLGKDSFPGPFTDQPSRSLKSVGEDSSCSIELSIEQRKKIEMEEADRQYALQVQHDLDTRSREPSSSSRPLSGQASTSSGYIPPKEPFNELSKEQKRQIEGDEKIAKTYQDEYDAEAIEIENLFHHSKKIKENSSEGEEDLDFFCNEKISSIDNPNLAGQLAKSLQQIFAFEKRKQEKASRQQNKDIEGGGGEDHSSEEDDWKDQSPFE